MSAPSQQDPSVEGSLQPLAVLGAGELVSHLHKIIDGELTAEYRFNVFRITSSDEVSHSLRTCDLLDLLKLCRVLAFAIADDGWITRSQRLALQRLSNQLDKVIEQGDDQHG